MAAFHYLKNGESLLLDEEKCVGCGACVEVCPHGVFSLEARGRGAKALVVDRRACMECGACAKNCPAGALSVKVGVGCAQAIILGKLRGTEPDCGCGGSGCCG
jgi:NAD-dependent dihydropyrimidine dehydrogenase PreA subunit